jgi:hypothetical protein
MDAIDPYITAGAASTAPTSAPPSPPPQSDPFLDAGAVEAPSASQDPFHAAGASTPSAPALSDEEFQQKMQSRWGQMLTGDKIATPADLTEMQSSGKFTPQQLQRVNTESQLRQAYADQQAQTFGQKAKAVASSTASGLGSMAQDVLVVPRIAQAAGELSVNNPGVMPTANRIAASALEGGSEAATGILGLAGGLLTGPFKAAGRAWNIGQPTPEQAYQKWKLDYLSTHNVPGYAPPPTSSRMQDLMAVGTKEAPESFPAPVAPLTSLASTYGTMAAFGGLDEIGAAAIPKILEATGAAEALPNLSRAITPSAPGAVNAGKLVKTMNEAVAGNPVTPSLASQAVSGAGNVAGKAVSGAGNAASAVADRISSIPGLDTDAGKFLATRVLGPHANLALGALKTLETAGPKASAVGDLMSRVATASPTDPFGRLMSIAADADAPPWMKSLVQNKAVQLAVKAGTLGAGAAKGFAKGAAAGAGISALSDNSPEETGQNIAGMGLFGAIHGGLGAQDAKVFQSNIGAVSKFITDSLNAGTTPETLKLVPASDIMQASLMKNALPDVNIRFSTAQDASSPFAPGGTAEGQGGYYDSSQGNKTLWIDPEKRAPGSTLLHEAYHPLFDNLVNEQPGIKDTLDRALAADGKTIDHFKLDYANQVFRGDPVKADAYIKAQDAANPNWAYTEMLSESAAHNLEGKDLLSTMQGNVTDQSATQAALGSVEGWLSDQGVKLQQNQTTGTIFPLFKDALSDPALRKLTYNLLKAQRDTVLKGPASDSPGTPLTAADMGSTKAPLYQGPNNEQINPYGREITKPTGEKDFKPWSGVELRQRAKAEHTARGKYFQVGKPVTAMPAGLEADPDIAPWTKRALRSVFDSIPAKTDLSGWYHRLNSENSATSEKSWASDVTRTLGNTKVSWQSGKPVSVEMTKQGNLITRWESGEALNQRLADWAGRHGEISLDLWGGDQAKARADIQTYLQNHAAGQPGDANGIGGQKRDTINALLSGDNKEFQDKNPLRAKLKKKDRAGVFRSLRVDRMESTTPEPAVNPPANWESLKRNLSPAAEPAKRLIELTGPDGKKYAAKYDGLQEDFRGGPPLIQITPQVDLPGATGAKSTTYAHSLLKKGYSIPSDLLDDIRAHVIPKMFSPSEDPNSVAAAAVRDEKTGRIYVGSSHGQALKKSPKSKENLVDGFVTKSGKFLTRDEAYAQAVAMKQYKPTDEDYSINRQLYGLTSERFNKQNPNTAYNIAKAEAALGTSKAVKEKTPDYAKMDAEWAARKSKGNFSPSADENIREQAAEYTKAAGLTAKPHTDFARLNEDLGKRAADAYEAAPHIPDDPKVQASYKALADETRAQWDFLTKKGVTFEPWTKEGQPYASSSEMRADVQQNKHLYFFPTEGGFGKGEQALKGWVVKSKSPIGGIEDESPMFYSQAEAQKWASEQRKGWKNVSVVQQRLKSSNPMLKDTGLKAGGEPLLVNDMFRAVHDYFGHAKEGYEFGPRGEYNAYLAHSKMFSKTAIPALTAETMGQNSWVNFGKHLRDEKGNIPKKGEAGYKSPTERPYAAQKATALPNELTQESLNPKQTFSPAQPESLSSAAVRVDKEHVFKSDVHTEAYAKARKAGHITGDDIGGPRVEEGFITTAGRFVGRQEGYNLADRAMQLHTREPALTDNGKWLDSSNVNAFSPAAKEDEKLSYPMEMTPGHNTGVLPGLLKAPYALRERYQADMLKAMEPLFAAFGAKPGDTQTSSYKNSAGETEHNPMTKVEVPATQAKLFGLLHGHFANQESVAGGFKETSPGKWEPVGPNAFDVQPTGGETFADKIKEMGPEAETLLAKLQPVVGPAVEAVNKKYSGLHAHQLSPSQDPRAVKSAAVRDENTGEIFTGFYHGEAFEKYLAENPGVKWPGADNDEEDNGGIYGAPAHLTEGFVTNEGEFLSRQEALERAMEMEQYKDASPGKDYGLESVSFEQQKKMGMKPDGFSPSEEPSEPPPYVPTGVLKHHGNNPAKAAAALEDAKPGQPIALGTFSPPAMSGKEFEKLAGKKMLFVVGDQSNAGPWYKTAGGQKAVRMMGGPGYPNMPETQGKAGWAFASKHLATRLAKAFKNVDYMAVFTGSPNMVAGAPSFSTAYLAELHEAIKTGKLKSGVLNRLAREAGRAVRERSSGGDSTPTIHNFSELERLLSKPPNRWAEDPMDRGLSFEGRAIVTRFLGSVKNSEKFGTPSYETVRDQYNDTGAFEQGQLAQIIQLHKDPMEVSTELGFPVEKTGAITTASEIGVPEYPDYPHVIRGTGLGQPPKKLMMSDVLKPWFESPVPAAQGGNEDYKVRMNMPQTEINPALFKKKPKK